MLQQTLWFFRTFWISSSLTVLGFIVALYYLGLSSLWVLLILVAIEITFSFDNAVVNAKKLVHMSDFWQKMFLTVGIVIAIFGMRLVFPLAIVVFTANIPWGEVVNLALNHPAEYAEKLELAHPSINAFGGAFLLMLVLHFFFDHKKQTHWLHLTEIPAKQFGLWWVPPILVTGAVLLVSTLPANHHGGQTLRAGFAGILLYSAIHALTWFMSKHSPEGNSGGAVKLTGLLGFTMFVYLQILDASFSFDGVLGAFAITNEVILIAAGLGIGAIWVRSLTVFMVRHGTLDAYKYLEHGAHYAIGALAFAMIVSLIYPVPEAVTGIVGLGLIGASAYASVKARKSGPKKRTLTTV